MVSRNQIDRLAQRIERLAIGHTDRIVVQGPDETKDEALCRASVLERSAYSRVIFIQTGVPRSPEWLQGIKSQG